MPTDKYEKYERACQKIRNDNAKLLVEFEQWLSKKGLADKTIRTSRICRWALLPLAWNTRAGI